jgi:hypothetical protein
MGFQPVTLVIPNQETGCRHPVAIAQHKRIKVHAASVIRLRLAA